MNRASFSIFFSPLHGSVFSRAWGASLPLALPLWILLISVRPFFQMVATRAGLRWWLYFVKFDGKAVTAALACWALRFWGNIFNRKPWELGVSLRTIDGSSSCRSRRWRFGTRWQIAPALIGQLEALMVRADFAKKKETWL